MSNRTPYAYPQFPLRRFIHEMTDGPFGSALTSSHYSDEGARVIRLGNIGSAHFKDADAAFIPMSYFQELRRHEVKAGDLLIAGLGDDRHPVGRACIAPPHLGPAIVKADCYRVRLDETRLTHRFAAWALGSSAVSDQVSASTRGSTRSRINLQVAREIHLPAPSIEEQRRIADFLDAETARMDKTIATAQRMRAVLRERKSAHRALILRGGHKLGGRRIHPMLGDLPDEWKVLPLRRLVPRIGVGVVVDPSSYFADEGVPFLHGANVLPEKFHLADVKRISLSDSRRLWRSQLFEGDVVVVRAGDPGRAAVVTRELNGANCASVLVLKKGETLLPGYLAAYFNSALGTAYVDSVRYGAAQEQINVSHVVDFMVPVPSIDEQKEILAELHRSAAPGVIMDRLLAKQSAVLAERRQALITAAVTGQIDVSTASGRGIGE
ncbi:restriction endonuclease subunit S [Streptomyces rhizosphaerihabitans]|uniref:restriction endonuclease subunit S n=1 Tax=Streptomyces rhizosphaerihabitans TaxID=1266770 RepID=UPI0021BE963A|nr:restriction endonuclease subunit S [Streptomyces rhizosphaerihabitans]MCT9010079.1 restriction endonuclease subunit S [Streptomyces rhizosphaerihabitans]